MNFKKRIKHFISVLPEKDQPIALNLIDKEDFQTLHELVESDIKKAEIKREKILIDSNIEKIDAIDLSISDMQALMVIIQSYIDEEEEFFHSLDTSSRMMNDNYNETEIIDF